MKIISKLKLLAAVITSLMMLIGVNSFALKGNHKGVPSIGSMVIMSGLENPWDIAFTVLRNDFRGTVSIQMNIKSIRSAIS